MDLDELDVKILDLLQRDGRASYSVIAEKLNVTPPTVRSRVDRLIDLGIIKNFGIQISADALPYLITGFLLVTTKPSNIESISKEIADLIEVKKIYHTTGDHSLFVEVVVNDFADFRELLNTKFSDIKEIEKIDTLIVTKTEKSDFSLDLRPTTIKLECAYCKTRITGEEYRWEESGKVYYFCCPVCKKSFQERLTELKEKTKKS